MSENYLRKLEALFGDNKVKLESLNKDCIRSKRFDFEVISDEKLKCYLDSDLNAKETTSTFSSWVFTN